MITESVKNRGYFKIKGAASAFNFDFKGKTVLDIGSSTGGFTGYALDHGAKKVIAVEKGTNQMQKPLRFDPHIELHEKTDIFNITKIEQLTTDTPNKDDSQTDYAKLDIILADVSFISLTKVLSHAKRYLAAPTTDFLVMMKPQFEARPHQLNSGVVKNDKIRREIIKNFEYWLKSNHFIIIKKRDNDLRGKTGNQERFYWLRLSTKNR